MTDHKLAVCVYCGASTGENPIFMQSADALGTALAKAGHKLVYGAGDVGLMGAVANAAQKAGGETLGVIPEHLLEWEVGKRDLTHFIVTETMHERKKVMVMNADAFVVLPGGFGSLDEFFELITWRQLGLHSKPAYILNINGYWDPLIKLIDNQIAEGFVRADNRAFFEVFDTVEETLGALTAAKV